MVLAVPLSTPVHLLWSSSSLWSTYHQPHAGLSRVCVVAPAFSDRSRRKSQCCVLVIFVSSTVPLQVCCTQAVLNKHLGDFNQPFCPLPLPLGGCPAGGIVGNGSVSASFSIICSAWVKKRPVPWPLRSRPPPPKPDDFPVPFSLGWGRGFHPAEGSPPALCQHRVLWGGFSPCT